MSSMVLRIVVSARAQRFGRRALQRFCTNACDAHEGTASRTGGALQLLHCLPSLPAQALLGSFLRADAALANQSARFV